MRIALTLLALLAGTGWAKEPRRAAWGTKGNQIFRAGTNGRVKIYERDSDGSKKLTGGVTGRWTEDGVIFQHGDELLRVSPRSGQVESVEPGETRGSAQGLAAQPTGLSTEQAARNPKIKIVRGAPVLKPTWAWNGADAFALDMVKKYRKSLGITTEEETAALKNEAMPLLAAIFKKASQGELSETKMDELVRGTLGLANRALHDKPTSLKKWLQKSAKNDLTGTTESTLATGKRLTDKLLHKKLGRTSTFAVTGAMAGFNILNGNGVKHLPMAGMQALKVLQERAQKDRAKDTRVRRMQKILLTRGSQALNDAEKSKLDKIMMSIVDQRRVRLIGKAAKGLAVDTAVLDDVRVGHSFQRPNERFFLSATLPNGEKVKLLGSDIDLDAGAT